MGISSTVCAECGSTLVDYDGSLQDAARFINWTEIEEMAINMSCDACGFHYVAVYKFDRVELRGSRIA